MNILFTCAGRRNYLINYFKEALDGNGSVFAADMSANASALAEADDAFILPGVTEPNYFENLFLVAKANNIDIIISLNDLELPILAENKQKLGSVGITAIISDPAVIETCFDKLKTNSFAKKLGLRVPETYQNIEHLHRYLVDGSVTFPLVLKPRWGSASAGIEFVHDEEELHLAYALLQHQNGLKKDVPGHGNSAPPMIQEKMVGDEYGLDIINDLDGNHVAVIVKKKIEMRAGETDKAVTVQNPELAHIGSRIGNELKHIGNLDCDFFEVVGEYYLLEMNPRFGGGYPFSHEAGVNLPKAIISWVKGEDAPSDCFNYRPDVVFAKCDRLVSIHNGKLK